MCTLWKITTMIQKATLDYLKQLKENNYREWFHEHKTEYDAAKQNVIDTMNLLLAEINTFDKLGTFDVRKCVFRIARDTRFSKNKEPYKGNFGIILNDEGTTRSEHCGYYINIEPGACFLSSGVYMPMPDVLKAVREAIDCDFDEFRKIIGKKEFKQAFGDLTRDEDALTRVPQGFDKNSPAAEYLKLRHFYVHVNLTEKELLSKNFVQQAADYFRLMKPFKDFLNRAVVNR